MISLKQLEAFLASARLRSFVAAAAHLNTTQSNISKRILEFEWAIGEPLFERGAKSLSLTIKGKQILPLAENVLAAYSELAEVVESTNSFSGPFNLGSSSTIAESWLSVFIQHVRVQYPYIALNSQVAALAPLLGQLRNGSVDLLLAPIVGEMTDLKVVTLATEDVVWVSHPSLAPSERMVTLKRLAELPLLQHPSEEHQVTRLFADRGIKANTVATCSSFLTRAKFALSGVGITYLPRCMVERELSSGTLVLLECDIAPPPIHYGAVFRRSETSPLPMQLARIAAKVCDFKRFLQ